jgi:hypothetical protein
VVGKGAALRAERAGAFAQVAFPDGSGGAFHGDLLSLQNLEKQMRDMPQRSGLARGVRFL